MRSRQITLDALFIAMCTVLGYISIDLGVIKFSLESFPIIIAALVLSPIDGIIVASLGTLLYQILKWGLMSTTLMWIIPSIIFSIVIGIFIRYKNNNSNLYYFIAFFISGIIFTLCNTICMYIDANIWGYYTFQYVFGLLPIRLIAMTIKSIIYTLLIPRLVDTIKRTVI